LLKTNDILKTSKALKKYIIQRNFIYVIYFKYEYAFTFIHVTEK